MLDFKTFLSFFFFNLFLLNWVNSTKNNHLNYTNQPTTGGSNRQFSYPPTANRNYNHIEIDSPTSRYSGNTYGQYAYKSGYSTPKNLFKPEYTSYQVKSGFMSNPQINTGLNSNYTQNSSDIQYYYKQPLKYQYKPTVTAFKPNPVRSYPLRTKRIAAPRYHPKPMHTNLTYMGHERFIKCNDDFMRGIQYVTMVSAGYFMFKNDSSVMDSETVYFTGIKSSFEYRFEGMYKLYKEKLNNYSLYFELENVIPKFQGCAILSYLDNRKIYSKGLKDNVMFVYEMVPFWLDVIKENSLEMTDLNLSEMVHQLFWFFKRIFKSRLFARFFNSHNIGIKYVADVHQNMGLYRSIYSRPNVMYLYRHMENLSSRCDYANDSQFLSLLQRYLKDKQTSFQHVGESSIEICQQINVFNLLLLLEVSLFRSSGLMVDKSIIFKGCLDETEDLGFQCPPAILAVLGRNKFKQVVRQDQMTEMFYVGLANIRKNLLGYTTKSTISWMGMFLDELLRVFRLHMVGKVETSVGTNYVKQIKVNMEEQRKVIRKIEDLRNKAQNPNLYQDQMNKIKGVINKLTNLKIQAKDQEEGNKGTYQNMSVKTMKDKMGTGVPRGPSKASKTGLQMIYKEERPFKNKFEFKNNFDDFLNKRLADQEIDGIILDDPEVSKSEISRLKAKEHQLEASMDSSEQLRTIMKSQTKEDILSFESEIRNSQVIDKTKQQSQLSLESFSQSQINVTVSPDQKNELLIDQEEPMISDLEVSQTRIVDPDELETLSEKDDLMMGSRVNQTIDQINVADSSDHQKIQEIIDKDIIEIENVITQIDGSLKNPPKNESLVSGITEPANKLDTSVQFENGEAMKFINRIDNDGIEYLSMEINFNMINPKDFGFENFEEKDQAELEQKIQEHFITALQSDQEMQKLGLKVYDLI